MEIFEKQADGSVKIVQVPNFCCDCAHLIGVRENKTDYQKWICGHESNKIGVCPVRGQQMYQHLCIQIREGYKDSCPNYQEYKRPVYHQPPSTREEQQATPVAKPTIKFGGNFTELRDRAIKRSNKLTNDDLVNL